MEESTPSKKPNPWYGKIETLEQALKVIKESAYGFFFISILQAGLGFALGASLWIDAIIFSVLAAVLLKFKSRVAAVFLLIFSSAATVVTFINKFSPEPNVQMGGTNIFLSLVILWAAIRAVQATFKLPALQKEQSSMPQIIS